MRLRRLASRALDRVHRLTWPFAAPNVPDRVYPLRHTHTYVARPLQCDDATLDTKKTHQLCAPDTNAVED